jgi:DNA polymerase delta subunit 2
LNLPDSSDEWIAVVSGLQISVPSPSDAQIQMLAEYLTGEEGGPNDQSSASHISRLIIAGNSLTTVTESDPAFEQKKAVSDSFKFITLVH